MCHCITGYRNFRLNSILIHSIYSDDSLVVKNDRHSLSRVVIDENDLEMPYHRLRSSSITRERRSKRFEPKVSLKNRKGVVRMEDSWPIIIDKTDGHRISLFPERFGNGRETPRDGMFVRYNGYLSASVSCVIILYCLS